MFIIDPTQHYNQLAELLGEKNISELIIRYTITKNRNNFKGIGGARGVMVIVVGNGHGNTSSNPGQD